MPDDPAIAEEKALIQKANQLITRAVESATGNEAEQEPGKYLVYFDSPMKGRRLYLVTDDEQVADSTRRHIGRYYDLPGRVSVEASEPDAPVDETPRYDSSDALYQDLWW